ncbi:PAS domain-containing sensor histidine kinase [Thermodesulfobacteriota bacterium]
MILKTKKQIFIRSIIIALFVIAATFLHYQTDQGEIYRHVILREFYFLPIILGGFWYGAFGGLTVSLIITVLYLPFVLSSPEGIAGHNFGNIMQIILFNSIGLFVGWLSDREKKQQAKLLEAESLAAMGKAVSCIAHDMKTPLMAIGGFVRQVRRKLDDGKLGKKLDVAFGQVQRLESLVGDMLAFSKPLNLQCRQGNINDLIQEVLLTCEEKASRYHVGIVTELSETIPGTEYDSHRLLQAIINLVNNSIEVSHPGGTIIVRSGYQDSNVIVEVIDQGAGIPKDLQKDIFTPFITTKQEGTGLGLPIVKKVVEAHSGSIHVLDNTGKGMTFRIALPVLRPDFK